MVNQYVGLTTFKLDDKLCFHLNPDVFMLTVCVACPCFNDRLT